MDRFMTTRPVLLLTRCPLNMTVIILDNPQTPSLQKKNAHYSDTNNFWEINIIYKKTVHNLLNDNALNLQSSVWLFINLTL